MASLVLMGVSSLGLEMVLATSELAFMLLKGLGAAYLTYLGIGRWFHGLRRVKLFNHTTGSLFIAAGGTLAASHR